MVSIWIIWIFCLSGWYPHFKNPFSYFFVFLCSWVYFHYICYFDVYLLIDVACCFCFLFSRIFLIFYMCLFFFLIFCMCILFLWPVICSYALFVFLLSFNLWFCLKECFHLHKSVYALLWMGKYFQK